MLRVCLLHWKAREAAGHLETLRRAGYRVEYDEQFSPALMKRWREAPPDAFVIDLSRLPSQGREIAIALRQSPKTRLVPLVFCGGLAEKLSAVRAVLPDATYCELVTLEVSLQKGITERPANPVKPTAMMDRYKGRTAAQKLGIRQSSIIALIDAPSYALQVVGELPPDVEIVEKWTPKVSVTLCFLQDPGSVAALVSEVRECAVSSKLWMLWRKGGKAARGEVTEDLVRSTALSLGLVDYKVCSVDASWTAMLFARKS